MTNLSRLCAALLLTCCAAALSAQELSTSRNPAGFGAGSTRPVSGLVVLQGSSRTNVQVTVETPSRSFSRTIFADGAGSFGINVPIGQVIFTFEAEGFQTLRETTEIPPGNGVLPLQFMMRPLVSSTNTSKDPLVSVASLNIPREAREEYIAGQRAMERRQWKEARQHFEKALQKYPKFAHALHALAMLELQEQQTDRALDWLHQSVAVDSSFADGFMALAHLLNLLGRHVEAMGVAEKLVALRPDVAKGQYELGLAALALGQESRALEACTNIIKSPSGSLPEVRLLRAGVWLRQQKYTEVREELLAFLRESPNHWLVPHARKTLEEVEHNLAAKASPPS